MVALVSHKQAKKAFDVALQYNEENESFSPMDIFKKWRNIVAKFRLSSAKQKNFTDFFH